MISIVIPVFNGEAFLAETIDSALKQTVKVEIIVVDDGSTDSSAEIAEGMGVKVIRQVNKGLASARNTGIMNATGDYILPLDADDKLKENCVERIEQVIKDTNADVVAPSFTQFGLANADVILQFRPSFEDFKTGNKVGYCSAIRRSALLEIGGYSPRMIWGFEDYHLWFNLLKRKKTIVTIPEPLWFYRVRHGSMLATANQHADELMAQIRKDFHL